MTILLAAIDDSAACRPILQVARWAAKLIHAQLVAVHVQHDGSGETARATAQTLDIPLLVRSGETVAEIGAARQELHAVALAVGARSFPGGAMPAGHVALALAQETTVPMIIVPPDATNHRVDRILIALGRNGDSEIILALAKQLSPANEPDIVAVHVFRPDALPPFGDDPTFEAEVWAREFLRKATSTGAARVHLDLRVGDPAVQVSEAIRDLDADLVVLAWHRDWSDGHARIVRRVLETAHIPLVLLNAQPIDILVGATQEGRT
jgi:nucleotide-binding universal stress UspA family protein